MATVKVGNLEKGDLFIYGGVMWVRGRHQDERSVRATCLVDGEQTTIMSNVDVEKCDTK